MSRSPKRCSSSEPRMRRSTSSHRARRGSRYARRRSTSCPEIRWHASDGWIDERGHFVAEAVGAYTVKAEVRAQGPGAQGGASQPLQATAEVEVAREPEVGQA